MASPARRGSVRGCPRRSLCRPLAVLLWTASFPPRPRPVLCVRARADVSAGSAGDAGAGCRHYRQHRFGSRVDGVPGTGVYAMTKWTLEAMSDALRMETREFGVEPRGRVGYVHTGRCREGGGQGRCRKASQGPVQGGVAPRLMPRMYRLLPERVWDAFWARQFSRTG